jgi:N-formylglutamate deformylase
VYEELERLLDTIAARFPHFVVLDLHSYNHRRAGPHAPPADPRANPEVNVGTGSVDRAVFGPLIDRFMGDLASFDFMGRHLDVRENVRFRGREVARRIHERYPQRVCVISVELKKFFMDEWTGVGDVDQIQAIRDALHSTVPGMLEELERTADCHGAV